MTSSLLPDNFAELSMGEQIEALDRAITLTPGMLFPAFENWARAYRNSLVAQVAAGADPDVTPAEQGEPNITDQADQAGEAPARALDWRVLAALAAAGVGVFLVVS